MQANIGRYKDRDYYLEFPLGIVDDLSLCQRFIPSSVQELRDKKNEINLLDMTNLLLVVMTLAKEKSLLRIG